MANTDPQNKNLFSFQAFGDVTAAVAALGGVALAFGMLSNTILLLFGEASVFASTLTIADHIATAARVLPLVTIGIVIGIVLRIAYPIHRDSSVKEGKWERFFWRVFFVVLCISLILFVRPASIPLALAGFFGVVWARMAAKICNNAGITGEVPSFLVYIFGFVFVMVVAIAMGTGLRARLDRAEYSSVKLADAELQGSILLIAEKGIIIFNAGHSRPSYISAAKIESIEILETPKTPVRSIGCRVFAWPCYDGP